MMRSDVSLIKEELSNSLKLIESGLTNLDIEAAHFLNPPEFKFSYLQEKKFSTNQNKIPILIPKKNEVNSSHNFSKISNFEPIKNLTISSEEIKLKNLSVPPDLTFSFYSSTEEIIPIKMLVTPNSSTNSSVPQLNNIIYSSCPTLEKILSSSEENNSISENESELKISDKIEQSFTESKLKKENNSVIKMHDLVESLLEIRSALDNLEREAAHFLNPLESESSAQSSSFEDIELYSSVDN